MVSFLSILVLGFFLGMRHATDPDHVIAVTTIVTRESKLLRAALTGIWWGIGHTLTIFVVGTIIILFNVIVPARIGLSMELAVGIMLIILGLMNVVNFFRSSSNTLSTGPGPVVVHSHPHIHGSHVHTHPHAHSHADRAEPIQALDRTLGGSGAYRFLRPLLIGIVHGLAGSAAVALLVLATIRDIHWAIAYLLIFGVGTIAGMMLITMSIASAFRFMGRGREKFSQGLGLASGLISLVFGIFVAYQIGFAKGLFTGHPQWTPQ